jgi:hypothetical protein
MLDPVVQFFSRIFEAIGRGVGWLVSIILWPFVAMSRWYTRRGWIVRGVVGLAVLLFLGLNIYFFWVTQRWTNFNPNYVAAYELQNQKLMPGTQLPDAPNTCQPSAIVNVTAGLVDFNVNQNEWVPSMLFYKLGLFGVVPWKNTPFFDNKASFQLGVNQVVRRVSVELVDQLGRVRGTSQIDQNLQNARGNLAYDEESWYFGLDPFGFKTPTPSFYRTAAADLGRFNQSLGNCSATFDARADNLLQFIDRMASDIGSTSEILRSKMESSNAGWLDPRADDRFWFAYGQLYAYYGVLSATKADFGAVLVERNLTQIWDRTLEQLRASLNMQPMIVSNGAESSALMPSHLATLGFYLLRVRSNLVEIRSIIDR